MKKKYALFTNDVEDHSIWFNDLRYETGEKVVSDGMPMLLDIYAKLNIKTTFFFTGYMAEKFPEVVRMVLPYGHEVASHGYSHKVEEAFDVLPLNIQIDHLNKSKKLLEDISGQEVVSFRAPALRVNQNTPIALAETGFKIDSSVASQRFDMFLSFGGMNKLKWLFAPRLPYRTAKDNLFKKGNSSIIEVPLSAFLLPFTSTTMRIFPLVTSLQKVMINIESNFNSKPIVFDIHPNEFIDESDKDRIISRRASNPVSYILKDVLRGKLKIKNLGAPCIPIYRDLITYFISQNYKTVTLQEYCKVSNLL